MTKDVHLDIIPIGGIRVYFYETPNVKSPIKKFIDSLPKEDQARFFDVIDEIERNGLNAVRMTLKPIDGKVWEIKFRSIHSGFRVFYVLLESDLMIWLHAFNKKTQKTPQTELDVARRRLKEVLE